MNSHLIMSPEPIYSTPFSLITYLCGRLLYGAFRESLVLPRYYKWDVVKTRQASQGPTETRQKGHWEIMLYQGGGDKNTHTWERWTCANGKEWSRGTKEVLVIGLHMVGKMSLDLLNLETSKFLMHFREPGSSLYFIFVLYILIFFSFLIFLILIFLSFLYFSHFVSFSFSSNFFYLLPLNSKIALYLPPPPA
jgi:hypothetical protein